MSWARIASAAQLAAAVAVILRILFASADPIAYTDEQSYEQTTYTVPVSSTENDSDIYRELNIKMLRFLEFSSLNSDGSEDQQ
ncbi:hypothetical protein E2986_11151 [Frieseomelitta varia]|uniref:Uncharacterized protein n=1 Tax=Frieseomelitta varia TaxID=561572 RepID=A0A833W859_9HYME|nr:hypothetical protein E2986_11151 [Frieseomelitta varia]